MTSSYQLFSQWTFQATFVFQFLFIYFWLFISIFLSIYLSIYPKAHIKKTRTFYCKTQSLRREKISELLTRNWFMYGISSNRNLKIFFISDIFLWALSHGRAKAGRPPRTYVQQLCADTGCSHEDLPGPMHDRDEWRERVRELKC